MAESKFGTIPAEIGERDAFHVAVISMYAGERLLPGTRVKKDAANRAVQTLGDDAIGVVDPFRTRAVDTNTLFYLCLLPNTTKSLRHVWEHDDFPEEEEEDDYDPDYGDECSSC
jgi:hypothetical protein